MIDYSNKSEVYLLCMRRCYQLWLKGHTTDTYYLTLQQARQRIANIEQELLTRVPVKFCWEIEKLMLDVNTRP